MGKPNLDNYVEVPERLRQFFAKYPEGCLQGEGFFVRDAGADQGSVTGYVFRAFAHRSPEDEMPGIGTAYEPIPGKTPYTKDSEVMNAETSAWGRAITALGFDFGTIASREEVQNRRDADSGNAPEADGGGLDESPSPI